MRKVLVVFVLVQARLFGAEWVPWTETDLELYPRADYVYQHYHSVHSSSGSRHYAADDHFFSLGLSGSYASWSAELETTFSDTRHHSLSFDHLQITGRYQWISDIVGDVATITTGLTLIKAAKVAVKDPSSLHHGRNGVEAFVSIGKEVSCLDYWLSRGWAAMGFGVADHGSPWWRAQLAWEKNVQRTFCWRLFLTTLYGLGGEPLSLAKSFKGYGSVSHRSVDIGVRLSKTTDCWGTFLLEYSYRVYARNFPQCTSLFRLSCLYPFGL